MRKTNLFAVAAAVIATGLGVWAASNTDARVAPSMDKGVEPFYLMMNAKELPTAALCARRNFQAVREAQQEMTVRDTAAATGIKESTLRQLLKGLGKEGEIRCGVSLATNLLSERAVLDTQRPPGSLAERPLR